MSSRREEKEQRRAERIAAEEDAAKAEARKRRLGVAAGVALGLAAAAAVAYALLGRGGDESPSAKSSTAPLPKVEIPARRTTDLNAAVKAAGCRVRSFTPGPNDREHVTTRVQYKQNPPVFGPHDPTWASDGSYVGRTAPPTEKLVHALEHGRVIIQYRPGLDRHRLDQLQTLLAEKPKRGVISGYNTIVVQNTTGMTAQVAATAWGRQLLCPTFSDATFDALRAFRATFVDTGPEFIPNPE